MKCTFLFLFFCLLLTACGPTSMRLEGESEHWEAYAEVNQTGEWETISITFAYKGDDLSEIGMVRYQTESTVGRSSGERELNGRTFNTSGSSNGAKLSKGDNIEVLITWNDKTEQFVLKPN